MRRIACWSLLVISLIGLLWNSWGEVRHWWPPACDPQDYIKVARGSKSGFITPDGLEIVPLRFDDITEFGQSGRANASDKFHSGWDSIDARGRVVFHWPDSEGSYRFQDFDSRGISRLGVYKRNTSGREEWCWIRLDGSIIEPHTGTSSETDPTQWLAFWEHDKVGWMDVSGNIVLPATWDDAYDFNSSGLAAVSQNGKWGFIDSAGQIAIPLQWDYTTGFDAEHLAAVRSNEKWGLLTESGKLQIEPVWDELNYDPELKLYHVTRNELEGYIDRQGREVVAAQWIDARSDQGMIMVRDWNKWGACDTTGKLVLPVQYDACRYQPQSNCWIVDINGNYGLAGTEGQEITPLDYGQLNRAVDDVFVGHKQTSYDILTDTGQVLANVKSENTVGYVENRACIVTRNGLTGVMDLEGKVLIPCEWDHIYHTHQRPCTPPEKSAAFVASITHDSAFAASLPTVFGLRIPNEKRVMAVYNEQGKMIWHSEWRPQVRMYLLLSICGVLLSWVAIRRDKLLANERR